MKMSPRQSSRKLSIRTKLVGSFILTTSIMLVINALMYSNINQMFRNVEEVYIENVSINSLIAKLDAVQDAMTAFLNTKSSDAMEEYFRSEQDFSERLSSLNTLVTDNDLLLIEKNIYHMSETYLEITSDTIRSKRGRLIEKYKVSYQEATKLYEYLNTYLYSLNNKQFIHNTKHYNDLLASFQMMELITSTMLIFIFAVMLLLVLQLTKSIIDPLSNLAKAANEVACGKLEITLPHVISNDEVGVLTKAFHQMIDSIKSSIAKIKENMEIESRMKEKELLMEAHLKDAKLKYLQAQIHPHFLFNTLNAGAQLAMMEEADQTYEYIQNVASFYRYNLGNRKEWATLREEVELIDNYIYIMDVRYSGDIDFQREIDESLLEVHLPRMILQPIVENAIKYGVQEVEWEGLITLTIKSENDLVNICIKDNGIGMKKERIDAIMEEDTQIDQKQDSNGVGLLNVKKRLSLFYDRTDILHIYSEGIGNGTSVVITIPVKKD